MAAWILYVLAGVTLLYAVFLSDPAMGSPFFAVWYVLSAFLFGCAWLSSHNLWGVIPGWLLYGGICLLVILIILLGAAGVTILSAFHRKAPADLDVLIVLGALVYKTGPSKVLQYRLDAAAAYLRDNPHTRCIVSGGQGSNEPCPEGEVMKAYLVGKGIEEERIFMENRSCSTVENIRFSMEFCDPEKDRVAIVTNDFHLWRGMALARKAGFKDVYGISGRSRVIYLPNNFLRECCALIKDYLFRNI